MFEDYLQDAYAFYHLAEREANNEREAKMFYRASIFCAASALEAFVNFIGETFNQGRTLDRIELAFLNDKTLEISPSRAIIEERIKFNPIEGKIKFIINKFSVPIDLSKSPEWNNFNAFKELRNNLIHSRSINDEKSVAEYSDDIKKGLNANIDIMNSISVKLFNKPLRKNLIELKL